MERVFKPFLFGGTVFTLFLSLSILTLWQVEKMPLIPGFKQNKENIVPPEQLPLPEVVIDTKKDIDETKPHKLILEIGYGDTLGKMLSEEGIPAYQVHLAIKELQKYYSPRKLRPGHQLEITVARPEVDAKHKDLHELSIRPSLEQEYIVKRCAEGCFDIQKLDVKLERQEKHIEIKINSSLHDQLAEQGVPHGIISELIRVFSFNIDFQRNLQAGDRCEVYYSKYQDPKSGRERAGELLYANLKLNKADFPIYRFKNTSGEIGYYNATGQSVRNGLLRTPVDGARISSHFSTKRRHPILGFTRAHKGVDFAAPTGTPIMAAGSGVITRIGWVSGYGRYIRIRHNGEYSTAYAHMSRFKKGLQKGARIKQGDMIGYVGASGLASGPHLHYEVLRHGKQINPLQVKMLPVSRLTGAALTNFNKFKAEIDLKRKNNEEKLA